MKWLPINSEHFEIDTQGMSRPAAWATVALLVLALLVIAALVVAELMGGDIVLSGG